MIAACGDAKLMPLALSADRNVSSTASACAVGADTPTRLSSATNGTRPVRSDRTWLGECTSVVVLSRAADKGSLHASPSLVKPYAPPKPRARSITRGTCRGRSALAGRTPVRHPPGRVVEFDGGAAATARLLRPSIDPQLLAGPGVAGGATVPAEAVDPQHVLGPSEQAHRIGDRADRRGGQMSADKT